MADEIHSKFEEHEDDLEWQEKGDELYESMLDQMMEDFNTPFEQVIDQYAADLMYSVWFDPDVDRFDRADMMFEFFHYTGLDWNDFDWDLWKEWYDAA
jgi:AcrR family transcriptional regulator